MTAQFSLYPNALIRSEHPNIANYARVITKLLKRQGLIDRKRPGEAYRLLQ